MSKEGAPIELPKNVPYGDVKFSKKEKLLVGAYAANIPTGIATIAGTIISVSDGDLKRIVIGVAALVAEGGFGFFGARKTAKLIDRNHPPLPEPPKDIR